MTFLLQKQKVYENQTLPQKIQQLFTYFLKKNIMGDDFSMEMERSIEKVEFPSSI